MPMRSGQAAAYVNGVFAAIRRGDNVPRKLLLGLALSRRKLPPDIRQYIAGRLEQRITHMGRPVAHLTQQRGEGSRTFFDPAEGVRAIAAAFRRETLLVEYDEIHADLRECSKQAPFKYKAFRDEVKARAPLSERASLMRPNEVACAVLAQRHPGETYHSIRNTIKRALYKSD